MKLTKEQSKKISSTLAKKHNMNEGLVDYIFGKVLTRQLKRDKKLNKITNNLDNALNNLKKEVERMKQNGEEIPSEYKRILNMK